MMSVAKMGDVLIVAIALKVGLPLLVQISLLLAVRVVRPILMILQGVLSGMNVVRRRRVHHPSISVRGDLV
jgi:hypothetical protein